MCNPVLIAGVMAVAAAAATYQSMEAQKDMADKKAKLEKESARMQEQAASKARELDLKTLEAKATQTEQQGEVEAFDRVRQSAKEASAMRLASSEAGVMGTSIFRMMASSQIQGAHDLGIIDTNTKNAADQIGREKENVEATYDARHNQSKLTAKQARYTKNSAPGTGSILFGTTMAGISAGAGAYGGGGGPSTTSSTIPYIPAK